MTILKRARLIGAVAILSGAAALPVGAQTTPSAPSTSPPAVKPAPTPSTGPAVRPAERSAAATDSMIGRSVFSSDGNKVGSVQSVNMGPDGKVTGIRFKTGGFLGFGGKVVEIPEGRFTPSGANVQLGMTADEVSKLPEIKDES